MIPFTTFAKKIALAYIRTKFKILSAISPRKAAEKAFRLFITPQIRTLREVLPIFESAEKIEFSFEQEIIRGYRWNHPSKRKALILHGFESSVVNFDGYIQPLIQKGYEVLAFDAPAHGLSTGKTITVISYKNLVQYINEHFGPIDAFITHSFGGLTLSLALEEMPHDEKMKVVLIAPAAETRTAIDHFFELLELNGSVRKEFDQLITQMGGKPPEWYSVSRAAPSIKAQVLFLQDKEDEMTPMSDVTPIMNQHHPNFRFIISEGLGHRRIYRDESSIRTIVDFL